MTDSVDRYVAAAARENTRRSYAAAVRHFEEEWNGLLPATPDAIGRYLADHAATHSVNTLRQRLAALSRWHLDQGFADPTKSPLVRQVLRGIRALHPAAEKRARPLELDVLDRIDQWLETAITLAKHNGDQATYLRHTRNRSLLLLGFWRGFRSDELLNLQVQDVEISLGHGMSCYLGRSKADREMQGRVFKCPALSRLCPVTAFNAWVALANLTNGPVYRKVDRWGRVREEGLHASSIIPLLREVFTQAGVDSAQDYSSHSLRRGFAGWARASGWDLKELMEYVGWRDVKSAMRYLEVSSATLQARFEEGLAAALPPPPPQPAAQEDDCERRQAALIRVSLLMTRYSPQSRGLSRARRLIERNCFERYAMQRLDTDGKLYELTIPFEERDVLDEEVASLLDEMYRIADDNHCMLEVTFHEMTTDTYWE